MQEQLNYALRVQEKLKHQAVLTNKLQPNLSLKPHYSNPALLPTLSPPPANFLSSPISSQALPPTSLQIPQQISPHYNPQIVPPPVHPMSQSLTPQNVRQVQPQFLNQISPQFSNPQIGLQMTNQFPTQADSRLDVKGSNINSQTHALGTSTKKEPSIAAQIALGKCHINIITNNIRDSEKQGL